MIVNLLWCNDMLLGVFKNNDDAQAALDIYKNTVTKTLAFPDVRWERTQSGRWHNNYGIARLEVEERTVIEPKETV